MWQTILLLSSVVVIGAGQTVVFAILPASARSIGLSEIQSSLIFSVSALAGLVANPLWGRASDKIGRLPVVIFGLIAYGVLLAALAGILQVGFEGRFAGYILAALLICRASHGALATGVLPSTQAHLADISTSTGRVGGMAAATLAFGVGSLIGPAMVALLAPFGLLSSLWFFSAIAVAFAVLLIVLLARSPRLAPAEGKASAPLKFTAPLVQCLVLSAVFQIVFIGTLQLIGFIFQDRFGLPVADAVTFTSYALLAIALTMMVVQAGLVRFKTDRPKLLIVAGMVIGSAAYLVGSPGLGPSFAAASPILIGIAMAFILPSISAIASFAAGPQAYGAAMGAVGATQALGFLLGPLLASYFYSLDRALPLYVNAALLGFCFIIALLLPARVK